MFERIRIQDFADRTEIDPAKHLQHTWGTAKEVVSLRDLVSFEGAQFMQMEYLRLILTHVEAAGGNRSRVYENAKISLQQVSPGSFRIGQRVIEQQKFVLMMEKFNDTLFRKFCVLPGTAYLPPMVILGRVADGTLAIAHYVPPIAEMNGGSKWTLMDGLHRNYIIRAGGGTTMVVGIEGVHIPFPCDLHDWEEIRVVNSKPPLEERYFNLRPDRFRDLKKFGIDG